MSMARLSSSLAEGLADSSRLANDARSKNSNKTAAADQLDDAQMHHKLGICCHHAIMTSSMH